MTERRTKRGRIALRKGERVTGRARHGVEHTGVVIDALSFTWTWIRDDDGVVRELLRHTVKHARPE